MSERSGLVTTAELAASLGQSNLRIFDCTTYLDYQPPGSDVPYVAVPGGRPSRRHISRERTFSTCRASSPTRRPRFAS